MAAKKPKLTKAQEELLAKLTTLQKNVASFRITGMSAEKSYLKACKRLNKKPAKAPKQVALKMLSNVAVKAFVDSVINKDAKELAESSIMTRDEILQSWTREAKGNITRLMNFQPGIVGYDEEGEPIYGTVFSFKSSDEMAPEDLALISEISVNGKGELKIKIKDGQNAKKQLALLQGFEAAQKHLIVPEDKTLTPWSDIEGGIDD